MFNPRSDVHRERLKKAVEAHEQTLHAERNQRAKAVRSYIGFARGENSDDRSCRIVNPIFQAISTLVMLLSSGRTRYKIRSRNRANGSFARRFELHLNKLVTEIRLDDSLQSCILDACFKLGIGRNYMADSIPVVVENDVLSDPGRPFFGAVSFDNYFCDMGVQRPGQVSFEGDSYWAEWDRLNDSNLVDPKVASLLQPAEGTDYRGAEQHNTAQEASGHRSCREHRIADEIRLRDIYFPRGIVSQREGVIVTWPYKFDTPPLRIMPSEGEDHCGPYPKLRFDDAPDNIMPVSLAENLQAGDDFINSLWGKVAMQAQQQRSIPVYQKGAEGDAKRLKEARHGEWTGLDDVGSTDVVTLGGVDPSLAASLAAAFEAFDRQAGGLKLMAGLGPMSPTATQDQLLAGANNVFLQKKQMRVVEFKAGIGYGLARMMWNDRTRFSPGYQELPGFPEITYPDHWYPEDRQGAFDDYEIEPYTLPFKSPEQRLQGLLDMLNRVLAPLMPVFAAAGMTPRADEIMQTIADYGDMPELPSWLGVGGPAGGASEARQSPVTRRETLRRSVGTGGVQDPLTAALQQAAGAGP